LGGYQIINAQYFYNLYINFVCKPASFIIIISTNLAKKPSTSFAYYLPEARKTLPFN